MSTKQLKVFVTGPTGTTGRAVASMLLERGHHVTGFSRNPEKYGVHSNYTPVKGTQTADLAALRNAVEGHDVVINCFSPGHSGSKVYAELVEAAWRLKDAVKAAQSKPYYIYVGGAGSLLDPDNNLITLDEPEVLVKKYLIDGPIEHLAWLSSIIGLPAFTVYYRLRDWAHSERCFSFIPRLFTTWFESALVDLFGDGDRTMPHACRAALPFFEEDHTFNWSFLSPPWFYRDGPGVGEKYGIVKDYQPVDDRGRWLGINSGDLALAIVDEAEKQSKKWIHWSCYAKQPDAAYFYDDFKDMKIVSKV